VVWLADQLGVPRETIAGAADVDVPDIASLLGRISELEADLAQAQGVDERVAALEGELKNATEQVRALREELDEARSSQMTPEQVLVQHLNMGDLAPRFLAGDTNDPETQRNAWRALLPAYESMTKGRTNKP
jgi:hypothetical protein